MKTEFGTLVALVAHRWRVKLDERLRHLDLNQTRWRILLQLHRVGPLSQTALAEQIGIEGPTLVRILDNMERRDLVVRTVCADDRRVKFVAITETAKPLITEIKQIAETLSHELLAEIPDPDMDVTTNALQTIANHLEEN